MTPANGDHAAVRGEPITRAKYVEAQLAVARAKLAMYEEWVRENLPECPLLPENIVADNARRSEGS